MERALSRLSKKKSRQCRDFLFHPQTAVTQMPEGGVPENGSQSTGKVYSPYRTVRTFRFLQKWPTHAPADAFASTGLTEGCIKNLLKDPRDLSGFWQVEPKNIGGH
jgi:hypothetical protein